MDDDVGIVVMFLKSVVVALVCIFRNVVGAIVLICRNIQVLKI